MKIYFEFYNSLKIIAIRHLEMLTDRDDNKNESNKLTEKFDDTKTNIFKVINQARFKSNSTESFDKFLVDLRELLKNYNSNNDYTLDYANQYLIKPLITKTITYPEHSHTVGLWELSRVARKCYSKLLSNKKKKLVDYSNWKNNYILMNEILDKFIEIEYKDLVEKYKDEPISETANAIT